MIADGALRRLPALSVRDNVGLDGGSLQVAIGLADGPLAVAGTDILTVRGVFNSSIYQVDAAGGAVTLFDAGGVPTADSSQATSGTIVVSSVSPTGGPQPLEDLSATVSLGLGEALVLVSSVDESIYGVVELDPTNSSVSSTAITIAFRVTGGAYTGDYRELYASGNGVNPALPENLSAIAWLGVLEEYRFYVRDADPNPVLSMARMLPGTETPHGGDASAELDIAENVQQLQVALGFHSSLGAAQTDQNGDGRTDEDDLVLTETGDGNNDDWLFNGDGDNPAVTPWVPPWDDDPATVGIPEQPELHYVRLTTVARVRSPAFDYTADVIPVLENAEVDALNEEEQLRYRRQLLQTIIDLRNIS